MSSTVRHAHPVDVTDLRADFVRRAGCQIVRHSLLGRGLARAVVAEEDGSPVAYGVVRTFEEPHTLIEFHCARDDRWRELAAHLLVHAEAPVIEAQTNLPGMMRLIEAFGGPTEDGPTLFAWEGDRSLPNPGGSVRRRRDDDAIFPHTFEPVGSHVLEVQGQVVATGGWFTHYNPPYADLYMEVHPEHRRRGYASYLLQELARECLDQGLAPAARCNPENLPSAGWLVKAGLRVCGKIVSAPVQAKMAAP